MKTSCTSRTTIKAILFNLLMWAIVMVPVGFGLQVMAQDLASLKGMMSGETPGFQNVGILLESVEAGSPSLADRDS